MIKTPGFTLLYRLSFKYNFSFLCSIFIIVFIFHHQQQQWNCEGGSKQLSWVVCAASLYDGL